MVSVLCQSTAQSSSEWLVYQCLIASRAVCLHRSAIAVPNVPAASIVRMRSCVSGCLVHPADFTLATR